MPWAEEPGGVELHGGETSAGRQRSTLESSRSETLKQIVNNKLAQILELHLQQTNLVKD